MLPLLHSRRGREPTTSEVLEHEGHRGSPRVWWDTWSSLPSHDPRRETSETRRRHSAQGHRPPPAEKDVVKRGWRKGGGVSLSPTLYRVLAPGTWRRPCLLPILTHPLGTPIRKADAGRTAVGHGPRIKRIDILIQSNPTLLISATYIPRSRHRSCITLTYLRLKKNHNSTNNTNNNSSVHLETGL